MVLSPRFQNIPALVPRIVIILVREEVFNFFSSAVGFGYSLL